MRNSEIGVRNQWINHDKGCYSYPKSVVSNLKSQILDDLPLERILGGILSRGDGENLGLIHPVWRPGSSKAILWQFVVVGMAGI